MRLTENTQEHLSIQKRLKEDEDSSFWFLPDLKSFVTLNGDRQGVSIYPLDLEDVLKKKGDPWLYATSIPPLKAVRGSELSHQFQALSSFDNVEYSLESPVAGLTLSLQGELHWEVPIDFKQDSAGIVVRAAASDLETFVSYEIAVQSPPEPETHPAEKQADAPLDSTTPRKERPFYRKGCQTRHRRHSRGKPALAIASAEHEQPRIARN